MVEQGIRGTVESAITNLGSGRFIPYIAMHEFEGLLFSDPRRFAYSIGRPELAEDFEAIASEFDCPEQCWQPAKVGHFETREIRDRERAW